VRHALLYPGVLLALFLRCGGEAPTSAPTASETPAPAAIPTPAVPPPETAREPIPCDGFALPVREVRSPIAVPNTAELTAARAVLERVVRTHGLDPGNPWAIGHALIALGPTARLPGDIDPVDHLFATYAEEVQVDGVTRVRFPRSRGDVRIEPHTDLLLKAFAEIGVAPGRTVTVAGVQHTVGDLVCHSLDRAWVDGDDVAFDSWNDTPWSLQGLSTYAPIGLKWTADGGHPMSLDGFASAVVAKHRSEVGFIHEAMRNGQTFQKRKQGIFGYTCGGAHLLQGAAFAVGRGVGGEPAREPLRADVSTWFARYAVEMRMLDAAIQQYPEYRLKLVVQRLKFLGHFTESAHKLAAVGLLEPDEAQARILAAVLSGLVDTVSALEASGVLDKLPELRASDEQLYLDVIGDSAHAMRGIDLATGASSLRL
jgi:hypothetical protein